MPLSIIVCEDNGVISLDLRSILKRLGHKVILSCQSGKDVLEQLNKGLSAELIIIDVRLKGDMDGYQLAAVLLKTYNFPVIFITGSGSRQYKKDYLTNERTCFIKKPFNQEEIHSAIEQLIHN